MTKPPRAPSLGASLSKADGSSLESLREAVQCNDPERLCAALNGILLPRESVEQLLIEADRAAVGLVNRCQQELTVPGTDVVDSIYLLGAEITRYLGVRAMLLESGVQTGSD